MLCCLLAALLAFAGVRGRHPPSDRRMRGTARVAGFGVCCGVLAFEVVGALCVAGGGLHTRLPLLLLVAASAATVLGTLVALGGGVPTGRRAWALFALATSAGSALTELADLHLLRIHTGESVVATVALHGLSVVAGLVAARLLIQLGGDHDPAGALPRRRARRPTSA